MKQALLRNQELSSRVADSGSFPEIHAFGQTRRSSVWGLSVRVLFPIKEKAMDRPNSPE